MKKIKYILMFLLAFSAFSCEEETIRGQFPVDGIAPQVVSNVEVKNIKGGTILTYKVPTDLDLLYIEAEYEVNNGKRRLKKVSSFVNNMELRGFAKATQAQVKLTSVDKSKNRSESVTVDISPEDSPIFEIKESIQLETSFGGFKIAWENPLQEQIAVRTLAKSEDGKFLPTADAFFGNDAKVNTAVRGQKGVETEFAIFVEDIYENQSDTLFYTTTPLREDFLDASIWKEMTLCSDFRYSQYNKGWSTVLDGKKTDDLIYYLERNGTDEPISFTFDLGVEVQLSRFKYWARPRFPYDLHHARFFEVWGTNDADVAVGDPCSFDGWTLLMNGESVKPSGLDYGSVTEQDVQAAHEGEEFEFPVDGVPSVRYLRYRCLETWSKSNKLNVEELDIWGEIKE
ncbi:DUF5000 domain-containing lipoprotein [Reichenbachiella sp. MALMAid0571]|uniref:DUF5000 domain-containing lipoprotein n=1 Tax=Reichenbachiella sp. MALMAid0571 TaxID=3143939 RepID=UPI0032E03D7D